MSLRLSATIFRHNARLMLRDPAPMVALLLMPLVMMVFLKPTYEVVLENQGLAGVNGAEQAVPGLTVLFSFFWVSFVAYSFFREYGWGTWERLRASPASTADILIGKTLPAVILVALQFSVLFGLGAIIFDLDVEGSVIALVLILTALAICVVAATFALVALARTYSQVEAFSYFAAMVLGGLGGGLAPVDALPQWAQDVAPATPTYWAVEGLQGVILDGDDIVSALDSVGVILLFALGFATVAALRFRVTETKVLDT